MWPRGAVASAAAGARGARAARRSLAATSSAVRSTAARRGLAAASAADARRRFPSDGRFASPPLWLDHDVLLAAVGFGEAWDQHAVRTGRIVSALCGAGAGISLVCLFVPRLEQERVPVPAPRAPAASTRDGTSTASSAARLDAAARHLVRKNSALSVHEEYSFSGEVPLGVGSFGVVHRAFHARTGAERAVKCVDRRQAAPTAPPVAEVAAFALTDHPNICRLVEYFDTGRYIWLVMELCRGQELCDHLLSHPGGLTESEAARLLAQMVRAALHCHRRAGVVHRDLKPENFLFQDGTLRLIDFGFASLMDENDRNSRRAPTGELPQSGTLVYSSPERLRGEAPAHSDDLWSLGVIFHILLTGEFPFSTNDDDQFRELLNSGRLEEDVQVHLKRLRVSSAARDLAAKLLDCNPKRRITAAAALRHPFLAGAQESEAQLGSMALEDVQERAGRFLRAPLLRQIAATAAVRLLGDEDLAAARAAFVTLDKSGEGRVAVTDLCRVSSPGGSGGIQVHGAVAATLGYSQFLAATLDETALSNDHRLCRAVFDLLDADHDGALSAEDLHRRLALPKSELDQALVDAMSAIGMAPAKQHGRVRSSTKIDFHDFLRFLEPGVRTEAEWLPQSIAPRMPLFPH